MVWRRLVRGVLVALRDLIGKHSKADQLFDKGTNILDESCTQANGNFEIGGILHLKSEIRNFQLDWQTPRDSSSPIGNFGFRI